LRPADQYALSRAGLHADNPAVPRMQWLESHQREPRTTDVDGGAYSLNVAASTAVRQGRRASRLFMSDATAFAVLAR
jgi:hypothetical protein